MVLEIIIFIFCAIIILVIILYGNDRYEVYRIIWLIFWLGILICAIIGIIKI
jgi:hypothetical protein